MREDTESVHKVPRADKQVSACLASLFADSDSCVSSRSSASFTRDLERRSCIVFPGRTTVPECWARGYTQVKVGA